MKNNKENKKKLLFIVPNIILSVILMVFYFTNNEPGFPYSIIPSYFFGVIAAIFTMYVVHPRVKAGKYNRRSFRVFNIAILLLSVLIIALLIVYKN
jgi:4-hydroxybenzoate polyprenyltransferase